MPYYTEALEAYRRILGNEHSDRLSLIYKMGLVLEYQNKFDEAMPYLVELVETSRRIYGVNHSKTSQSLKKMIRFHNEWHSAEPDAGHDAKAAAYRAQLDAINAKAEEPLVQ